MQLEKFGLTENNIEDWTDMYFGRGKRVGYVEVTNFEERYFFGQGQVNAVKNTIKCLEGDTYVSLNAFKFGSRKAKDLKQVRVIGLDVDCHKVGMSHADIIDYLNNKVEEGYIPKPNVIQFARGVQIFYSLEDGVSYKLGWLTQKITVALVEKLEEVGADDGATGVTRLMRAPGSIHTGVGVKVKEYIWRKEEYSLEEIQKFVTDDKEEKKEKKEKGRKVGSRRSKISSIFRNNKDERLSTFHNINWRRVSDLDTLRKIREGDFTYCRNFYIYISAYQIGLLCGSYTELEQSMDNLHKRIYSKEEGYMSDEDYFRTLESAWEDKEFFFKHFKEHGYRMFGSDQDGIIKPMKNKKIVKRLLITDEEQRKLSSIVGDEVSRERETVSRRVRRRKKGVEERDKYLEKCRSKKEEGRFLKEQGFKYKQIAEELDVNLNTVKGWFRKKKEG